MEKYILVKGIVFIWFLGRTLKADIFSFPVESQVFLERRRWLEHSGTMTPQIK